MKYPFEADTKMDLTEDNPFFLEGKEAYKHGYPIGDCVYPSGSKMRKFWMKGYRNIPDAVANTLKRCHQDEASKKLGAMGFVNYLNSKPNIKAVLVDAQVSQPIEPLAERYFMNLPKDRNAIKNAHHFILFTDKKSAKKDLPFNS